MYILNRLLLVVFSLVALACSSDYKINPKVEEAKPGITTPEIEVDPIHHSYGSLSAGSETSDVVINIENIGNGDTGCICRSRWLRGL
jgi:hypothetical protein